MIDISQVILILVFMHLRLSASPFYRRRWTELHKTQNRAELTLDFYFNHRGIKHPTVGSSITDVHSSITHFHILEDQSIARDVGLFGILESNQKINFILEALNHQLLEGKLENTLTVTWKREVVSPVPSALNQTIPVGLGKLALLQTTDIS